MAVILRVSPEALAAASAAWDEDADGLDAVWRGLAKVEPGGLPSEVSAAVEAFLDQWVDDVKARATLAQDNADAVTAVGTDLTFADRGQAERLRGLLSWVDATAAIGGLA